MPLVYFSFFFENDIFTLSTSSSSKPFKHTIIGGLLSFEVLGGWRRLFRIEDLPVSSLAVEDLRMMPQLHAVYGEWLLKYCRWDFVVDNVKGARIIFFGGSRSKVETVSEFREEDDEADECFEDDDDDMVEDKNHDGEEDDGEEDADISIVAEADENGEDYSVYGNVEDEDEEDDDMCFEDFIKIEGGRLIGNNIYVNQSFVSKNALLSELWLTVVKWRFSFRIYKSTKTLLMTTCPWETDSLSGDTVLRSMLVGFSLIVLESLMVEKIHCSHAIVAEISAGLHISTLVCPVYSKDFLFAGYSENIYPCVGQQVEEHTCSSPDVKRGPGRQKKSRWQSWLELSKMRGHAQNARKLAIRNHNVRNDVDDLQVSRPVSRPEFFLPDDLQVSRPLFSLPEDLQVSRPEDLQVSRPGFFLPEDLQVSRPMFSLPEDLQVSRPEGRPVSRPVFTCLAPLIRTQVGIIVLVFELMRIRKLLKYIHRHLIPHNLPVGLSKSVHATITSSDRRYIGRSLTCEWLQAIRDHVEKRLHYHIEFFWGDTGTNAVKDDYVPLRDRYPHSNPMSVGVVHWCIDIINIHPPNLVRFPK
ncbi:hypothetical protein IGI04_007241 [Brassica rapa subsp. trilocularis]|uniref:Uncharacterized protein n=1 Tax=Brassica rapa subsp. trilocularis TaxID=1813537 RepID=A0ABQ7NJ62_BRACM|nr:hypothetical protein IGI04_007241 [Brassica rapa subsp. trilocularis]